LARVPALGLDTPGIAWSSGRPLRVVRDVGAPRVEAADGLLVLRAPDDQAARRALDRWYRARCRDLVGGCLPALAGQMGVAPGRVTIREARTRWGSCSASGDLSFNWRLALAPEPILRHVVVHELAHLVHRDHSHRFWAVVEANDPATPARRAFLRRHGAELLAYDPARALLPA
jgi:predicted metal-dependent hydrolase